MESQANPIPGKRLVRTIQATYDEQLSSIESDNLSGVVSDTLCWVHCPKQVT